MTICAVVDCSSRSEFKQDCGISFHKFPKDPVVRIAWIVAVRRENWRPSKTSVLCSRHFEESCFKRFPKLVKLIEGAIPTLFPTSYYQKKEVKYFAKMSCVAYGCYNNSAKKIAGITFHRFPRDEILRKKWVMAVKRDNWYPSKHSVICSEHFKESDFDRCSTLRVYLKPNVVPSVFKAFPKYLQKKPSACCNPVSVSSSSPIKQEPSDGTLAPRFENVGSTNEIVVDQNKTLATPTFGIYGKNDSDKNTVVIVSDTADYKNILNGHSDANRRIVVSDQLNPKNRSGNAFVCIENVGSTNDEVVIQNKPVATPTFSDYGKNDCDKNSMVIVSDIADYKNVLNSHMDTNRNIVISDQLIRKNSSGSALANTYQSNSGSTVPEAYEEIGVNTYEEDPLLLFEDEFHCQRIKELEEVVKALYKERKNWLAKIRRIKRKFKNLRKEYIRHNKKNRLFLSCNSQPVVHFLSLDVQNV